MRTFTRLPFAEFVLSQPLVSWETGVWFAKSRLPLTARRRKPRLSDRAASACFPQQAAPETGSGQVVAYCRKWSHKPGDGAGPHCGPRGSICPDLQMSRGDATLPLISVHSGAAGGGSLPAGSHPPAPVVRATPGADNPSSHPGFPCCRLRRAALDRLDSRCSPCRCCWEDRLSRGSVGSAGEAWHGGFPEPLLSTPV